MATATTGFTETSGALDPYRLQQLHSRRLGNEPVSSFDDLVTHHPIANAQARLVAGIPVDVENPRTRSYAVMGGEIQEIETRRTDGGRASALHEHQVLLIKDFILEDSAIATGGAGARDVDVPSPTAGYVSRVDSRLGAVDIRDREGGVLIGARAAHGSNPRSNWSIHCLWAGIGNAGQSRLACRRGQARAHGNRYLVLATV